MKGHVSDPIFFEEWLKEKRRIKDSTIFVYKRSLERFLAGDPDIENLEDYNNFLIKVSIKKRCTHYYSVLKAYIDFKIGDANVRDRIKKGLIKPPERNDTIRERKHLTEDKVFEVINNLDKHKHRVIALIQGIVGVRAGDIMLLKRGGIVPEEYNGKEVTRLNLLGKGDKRNVVYIHDSAAQEFIWDYISSHAGWNNYYFLELGTMKNRKGQVQDTNMMYKMNYWWYWDDLKQALDTAGISKQDFATHDFRRCFARRVWEKYKDIHKLQKVLNHSDPKVTMRYLDRSGLQNIDLHYEMQQ